MNIDPSTTKYLIKSNIVANGIVEKPDVVGAIFGQTEGLLGNELDLRDLQKSGRIGRIEVEIKEARGRSEGVITVPSSLDLVETAILASALETIDRVGPCKAEIKIDTVEDVRITKKKQIIDRAKELLVKLMEQSQTSGEGIAESVRQSMQVSEIIHFGKEKCPAGPNVEDSDAIIVVEGRNDVLNLLRYGVKNAIAVEGTNIPKTVQELSKERVVTVFVDGDRGGELILRELLQVAEVDFVARAPRNKEVEELTQKQIMKCLRNKVSSEQYLDMYNINGGAPSDSEKKQNSTRGGPDKRQDSRTAKKGSVSDSKPASPKPTSSKPSSISSASKDKTKTLSPEQLSYKRILTALQGTSKANFLGARNETLAEIPVRDMIKALKDMDRKITTLVFDGIITQRIVDIAVERGIKTVVGGRIGGLGKQPERLEIYTRDDL